MDEIKLKNKIQVGLTQLRKSRNVTQDKLAEMVGSNRVFIAKIESGVSNPSYDFVDKIAKALEAEVEINFKQSSSQESFAAKMQDNRKEYICVGCSHKWMSAVEHNVVQCPSCRKLQGISYADYNDAWNSSEAIILKMKASPLPPISSIKSEFPTIFKLISKSAGGTFPNPKLPLNIAMKILEQVRQKHERGCDDGGKE
jgi:transcriptional regulator with XRE-family HTH domain